MWAVGGSKGGVGKSFLVASMATVLARTGRSVIAVDASLGVPHLHAFLGVKASSPTLLDVLDSRSVLEDALVPTAEPGLRFLSCAGDQPGAADLPRGEFESVLRALSELPAAVVIADLGGGASFRVLDLFNAAREGFLVTTADPSAMQNAYGFIRNAAYRRVQQAFAEHESVIAALKHWWQRPGPAKPPTMMEFYDRLSAVDPCAAERAAAIVDSFRPLLLTNMAEAEEDRRAAEIIHAASRKFLNIDLRLCGPVLFEPAIGRSAPNATALDFSDPERKALRQIQNVALRILHAGGAPVAVPPGSGEGTAAAAPGLNDNLDFLGRELHVQTEDLGHTGRCIVTQVFCNGRVLFSTRADYPQNAHDADGRVQIGEQMRSQHLSVIREIEGTVARLQSA